MLYSFCVRLLEVIFFFVFRIRKTGTENIPKEGAALLAVNHKSNFDPIIAGITCPRKLRFMAKAELFNNKLFGGLISRLGAFPIHRGVGDIGAIKSAFKIFNEGEIMLIFPEGSRIKEGQKRRAKPGVALIAEKSCVPVIPVLIDGKYKWMGKITVRFGKPISYEKYKGARLTGEEIQSLSDEILESIYSLGKE